MVDRLSRNTFVGRWSCHKPYGTPNVTNLIEARLLIFKNIDLNCCFAATGITDGALLRGVRFDSFGCHTESLVMRSRSGTVRKVEAHHQISKLAEFSSIDYQ